MAPARRNDFENVVLKIAPPWEPVEIFGEAEYLRTREGRGCVGLLDEDQENKALLIERVIPGVSLDKFFMGREPEAIEPAIDALKTVLRPLTGLETHIASLDKWFYGLQRFSGTAFPAGYAEKALNIYEKLPAQSGRDFYLHGDFHPGNIVTGENSKFVVIDPKGLAGHIGYEIAVFLNNFHWWQEKKPDIRDILDKAVFQFANAFDILPFELRQWAYAQMVIGSWWNFADMPELYDGGVVKADIWDV